MSTASKEIAPRVPLLDLRAQYQTIKPEIEAAMRRVVESQHFILGPEVGGLRPQPRCAGSHEPGRPGVL
jgi:hypothetical protein